MTDYTLPAVVRPEITKTARKKFRNEGYIIANLHGRGGSESLALDGEAWIKYLREMHEGEVLEIEIANPEGGEVRNELVRIQDIMRTPMQKSVLHIDFMRLERGTPEEYEVPIRFSGIARGIKDGGEVKTVRPTVRVKCYPSIKPQFVSYNMTDLKLGDSVTAGQVKLPSRVTLAIPASETLLTCFKATAAAEE